MANKECFSCGNDDPKVSKVREDHSGKYFCAFKKSGQRKSCLQHAKDTWNTGKK
jgi:hypothetical protein